jgi:hypothetical protein
MVDEDFAVWYLNPVVVVAGSVIVLFSAVIVNERGR